MVSLASTVHIHKLLIYKETQKYLGTTNAQIRYDSICLIVATHILGL